MTINTQKPSHIIDWINDERFETEEAAVGAAQEMQEGHDCGDLWVCEEGDIMNGGDEGVWVICA